MPCTLFFLVIPTLSSHPNPFPLIQMSSPTPFPTSPPPLSLLLPLFLLILPSISPFSPSPPTSRAHASHVHYKNPSYLSPLPSSPQSPPSTSPLPPSPFPNGIVPPHWEYMLKIIKQPASSFNIQQINDLNDTARRVYLARRAIGEEFCGGEGG